MASTPPQKHHHYENPQSKCDMGDVSGDRPRILNLTIVGPKCGGGNPTTFIGKEGNAPLTRKHRRNSEDSAFSQNGPEMKRVKTKYGSYIVSGENEFELSITRDENTEEEYIQDTISTPPSSVVNDGSFSKSSLQSSVSSVSLRGPDSNPLLLAFTGSWADDLTPPPTQDDEGYHTDPNRGR